MMDVYREVTLQNFPVYVINLDKDFVQWNRVSSILKIHGFNNVNRIPAEKSEKNGQLGLINSHLMHLSTLETPFILLEDDVDLLGDNFTFLVPKCASAVYLGNSIWGMQEGRAMPKVDYIEVEGLPYLLKIKNMLSTHAILFLTREFLDSSLNLLRELLSKNNWSNPRVDKAYALMQRSNDVFLLDPPLFYQKDNEFSMTKNEKYTNKPIKRYSIIYIRLRYWLFRLLSFN